MRRTCTSLRRCFLLLGALGLLLSVSAPALFAQPQKLEDEIRVMKREIERLHQELDSLRQEVRRNANLARTVQVATTAVETMPLPETTEDAPPIPQGPPAAAQQQELTPAEALPLLQAQIAEHAQTKVETNSKMGMKIFGTIVANTMLNTGEPNWLDIGNVVTPRPAGLPTGSFTVSMRQSRIGAILDGPSIGSWRAAGFLAMDFFGGIPNFQTGQSIPLPRLLYGYMRLERNRTAFQIGQDHVILAPKNPTSLTGMAFPILFRSGNLYLRAPQLRVEQTLASGSAGEFRAVVGITAPIAGDINPNTPGYGFVPQNQAGERSRRPAVQARFSVRERPAGPYEEPLWEIGVSGHYARERFTTGLLPSWAGSFDFDATAGPVGIGGELFLGRNIDSFGASLAAIARSRGGFVEARLAATERLEFNAGYGTDRLFDLRSFPAAGNRQNASWFANWIYRLTPELASSLEWRWLETRPRTGGPNTFRKNNHFNLTFAYSF